MSIALAKSASIADGPALNAFHSICTPGPTAFSNWPPARPTEAWACVIFGKYPTRRIRGFCWAPDAEAARRRIANRMLGAHIPLSPLPVNRQILDIFPILICAHFAFQNKNPTASFVLAVGF